MSYLLDTHALLWYINGAEELPVHTKSLIANTNEDVFVSVASIWEITIKSAQGKLPILVNLHDFLDLIGRIGFPRLQVNDMHLLQLHQLPFYHRDPFDRLLIAQAIAEGLTFISKDAAMQEYPVEVLW